MIRITGLADDGYKAVTNGHLHLHRFFIGYWIITGLDFYPGPFLFLVNYIIFFDNGIFAEKSG